MAAGPLMASVGPERRFRFDRLKADFFVPRNEDEEEDDVRSRLKCLPSQGSKTKPPTTEPDQGFYGGEGNSLLLETLQSHPGADSANAAFLRLLPNGLPWPWLSLKVEQLSLLLGLRNLLCLIGVQDCLVLVLVF